MVSLSFLLSSFVLTAGGFIYTRVQQCEFGENVGEVELPKGTPKTSHNYGKDYLARNYFVSCCGLLSTWVLHAGRAGNITLRVWRPLGENEQFSLWAETNISVRKVNSTTSHTLLSEEKIPVIPGDVIGWETVGLDIVSHIDDVEDTPGSDETYFRDVTSAASPLFDTGKAEKSNILYNIGAYLHRSSPLVFQNLPHTIRISVDEHIGSVLFVTKVNTTNVLQRQLLTFSIPELYYGGSFGINTNTGEVIVADTLSVGEFRITVNVSDACGETKSELLIVHIVKIAENFTDSKLYIRNFPDTLSVPEDTPEGTVIFTLRNPHLSDIERPQFKFATDQIDVLSIFQLNTETGELILRQGLDHELCANYNLSFAVRNGNMTSNPEVLVIEVIDVNEPPAFAVSHYTVQTNVWQLFPEIYYNVTDQDLNDTFTYSFVDGSSSTQEWLLIDAATGRLQYQYQYHTSRNDVPEMFSIDIEVQDREGLKDSATLQIFLKQSSTNLTFTVKTVEIALQSENNGTIVYVAKSSPISTMVSQLLFYDVDCSNNDFIRFSVNKSPGSQYFGILSDGTIYLKALLSDTDEMFINLHVNVDYCHAQSNIITVYVIILEDAKRINSPWLEILNRYRNEATRQTFYWIMGSVLCFNVIIFIVATFYLRYLQKRKLSTCDNLPSHLIETQRIRGEENIEITKHNLCQKLPEIHTYAINGNYTNCTDRKILNLYPHKLV